MEDFFALNLLSALAVLSVQDSSPDCPVPQIRKTVSVKRFSTCDLVQHRKTYHTPSNVAFRRICTICDVVVLLRRAALSRSRKRVDTALAAKHIRKAFDNHDSGSNGSVGCCCWREKEDSKTANTQGYTRFRGEGVGKCRVCTVRVCRS